MLRRKAELVATSSRAVLRKAIRLTSQVAMIVAAHSRIREGLESVAADRELGHAANLLWMLKGTKPSRDAAQLIDRDLILRAEHGSNASSFTARVVIGTEANLHAAMTAAIAALSGPAHGGAAEDVMKMAQEIGDPARAAEYVRAKRKAGEPVTGFGRRVYRAEDPRARHMRAGVEKLSKEMGEPRWYEILQAVVLAMAPYARHGVNVNVDFYSGVVYHLLGIKRDLFVPIFAVGRVPGWVVQVLEQMDNNILIRAAHALLRPAAAQLPADQRALAWCGILLAEKLRRIARCGLVPFCLKLCKRQSHGTTSGHRHRIRRSREDNMHVMRKLALLSVVACAGSALAAVPVCAAYPERPIELIVPWGPGGGADQLARLVSKLAEPLLSQGIPVVNVPGATGGTGMAKLLAAPADGYSAAIYIADSHVLLAGKNPRWSMSDIVPVAVMIEGPSFIFVARDSRFKTWQDFENEAKANPGKLKIATLGFGSVDDLSISVIERSKGLKFVQVPFSKPSERYVSILGGHADALYEQAGDVASFLNNKQMRPLLIFGKQRLPAFKDTPSSYELGIPVALPQFRAIVVRAGTPADIIERLSKTLADIAHTDEYKKFLAEQFAVPTSFKDASMAPAYVSQQLEDMKKAMAAQ